MPRNVIPLNDQSEQTQRMLNIGCGRHYHSAWTNLDLVSSDPSVICHDITTGIPFGDATFDAVYHSHVLEHLRPKEGKQLITECFRVLKPGGILRIVVPDLEEIAQLYLSMHEQAWQGNERAAVNYNWMKMELLDQMVRTQSGGQMGPYMQAIEDEKAVFVRARLGSEFHACRDAIVDPTQDAKKSIWQRLGVWFKQLRVSTAMNVVRYLMGEEQQKAFEESMFRNQGEVHRWMYDRYSLRELCREIGFRRFSITTAFASQIDDFVEFQLDALGNQIRKPDSLFVECFKPPVAKKAAA